MPDMDDTRAADIFEAIVDATDAADPPPGWEFLTSDSNLRRAPDDPRELLESLEAAFERSQLEEVGVITPGRDDSVWFNPVFGAPFLALRRSVDEAPFDLVNQEGSLVSHDPPSFVCSDDWSTNQAARDGKRILVPFSNNDLIILRMLHLPCTPAFGLASIGLASIDGQQVSRLFKIPSRNGNRATCPIRRSRFKLTLVAWDIARLKSTIPVGLGPVLSRLRKAESLYHCKVADSIDIWRPTPKSLRQIRVAADFADQDELLSLLMKSITASSYSPAGFARASAPPEKNDYPTARQRLLESLQHAREIGFGAEEIKRRLLKLDKAFNTEVVEAIIQDAGSAPSGLSRGLLLAAAELMEQWYASSDVVVSSSQRDPMKRVSTRPDPLRSEQLKQRRQIADSLVKIHRELTRDM
jgi:hypothetical protein